MQSKLKEYMAKTGASAVRVAAQIGVSGATLNLWLNNKYVGSNKKVADSVNKFLKRQAEKSALRKIDVPFVPTSVYKQINSIARLAHLDGEICVCTGEAGVGKTEAVKMYTKENPGVILLEIDLGYSARVLFSELHKALDFSGHGVIHDMFMDCVNKLRGTERLIILDEAEHLPYKALELLRRLHDKAGIGLLLVGLPRLFENIRGRRSEYAQLYSRVGGYMKLKNITEQDGMDIVRSFIPANGTSKIFYREAACNTRSLVKLVRRTMLYSEANNCKIDESVIKKTAQILII